MFHENRNRNSERVAVVAGGSLFSSPHHSNQQQHQQSEELLAVLSLYLRERKRRGRELRPAALLSLSLQAARLWHHTASKEITPPHASASPLLSQCFCFFVNIC
jgi:hypothetical protein